MTSYDDDVFNCDIRNKRIEPAGMMRFTEVWTTTTCAVTAQEISSNASDD